jgi:hypothetical protein
MANFAEIERLVRYDIDDAFIAERMWRHLRLRAAEIDWSKNPEEAKGLAAIERALALRFLIAVQRLLQGRQDKKANLDALVHSSQQILYTDIFRALETDLNIIRNSANAKQLREARNAFMAHTRIRPEIG